MESVVVSFDQLPTDFRANERPRPHVERPVRTKRGLETRSMLKPGPRSYINPVVLVGDHAALGLVDRRGIVICWTKIDVADIPRIQSLNLTWLARRFRRGVIRAAACRQVSGRAHCWFLARAILDPQDENPLFVDHKNGDCLDDRRDNLRFATPSENAQNVRGARGVSGVRGVWLDRGSISNPYRAAITLDGRRTFVGRFPTLEDASSAIERARAKLHAFCPENSCHNVEAAEEGRVLSVCERRPNTINGAA